MKQDEIYKKFKGDPEKAIEKDLVRSEDKKKLEDRLQGKYK